MQEEANLTVGQPFSQKPGQEHQLIVMHPDTIIRFGDFRHAVEKDFVDFFVNLPEASLVYRTDREIVKELFMEYARSLEFSLGFQDFEEEIAEMPGHYGPPDGCTLLAFCDDKPAGCVALRKLEEGTCEMKRLYVKPEFRGLGLGKTLSEMIIEETKLIGYKKMRLDTLANMKEAISIYRNLGFYDIESYRYNPFDHAVFLEKEL